MVYPLILFSLMLSFSNMWYTSYTVFRMGPFCYLLLSALITRGQRLRSNHWPEHSPKKKKYCCPPLTRIVICRHLLMVTFALILHFGVAGERELRAKEERSWGVTSKNEKWLDLTEEWNMILRVNEEWDPERKKEEEKKGTAYACEEGL